MGAGFPRVSDPVGQREREAECHLLLPYAGGFKDQPSDSNVRGDYQDTEYQETGITGDQHRLVSIQFINVTDLFKEPAFGLSLLCLYSSFN